MNQTFVGRIALLLSASVHAWVFTREPQVGVARPREPEVTRVEFLVAPGEVEAEKRTPDVLPEAEREPEVKSPPPQPVATPIAAAEAPKEAEPTQTTEANAEDVPEPPSAEPEAPAELTGTTLTSDRGAGWTAPRGSGGGRLGPIRSGVSRQGRRNRGDHTAQARSDRPQPAAAVALSRLSKKPVPPSLGAVLRQNYPPEARRQGKSGEAKVRARIEANGTIRMTRIASESAGGFGMACQKALLQSKWSPPRNRQGKPVPTWVSYRCKFRIDD